MTDNKNIELNDELLAKATGGEDSGGDPTCDPRFSVGDLVLLVDDDGSQYDKIEIKQVQIKDLSVVLVVDTYNLQIVFANPTNTDQEFDLKKLKVENYDGTEIKVFTVNEKPAVIGARLEYSQNAYTISDPGNLSLGDEVSFYYDGAFIHKAIITEF